jgi:hypothetical protein
MENYQKLAEASQSLRDPLLDSDIASLKITKLANSFISKVKESSGMRKSFFDVFGTENDFFLQIKSENFKFPFLGLLQFTNEVLETARVSSPVKNIVSESGRRYSSMADDDYFKLIEESENLAKTISSQKIKISRICDKVRENMKVGPKVDAPLSRPKSLMIERSNF